MTQPAHISNRLQRRLSPTAQPGGSTLRMVLGQIKSEFLAAFRVPEFLVGIVAIPVMLYAMFGLTSNGTYSDGTQVRALMMASFSAYGLLSLAIFTFGVDVAQDRKGGWLKLMGVTPMPAWVYFAGKFAMSLLFGAITLLVMFGVAALLGGVRLPLEKWLTSFGILLLGGLSLSTLGFALGYWARPKAASTIANLVYLPLSFASGFFFPLNQLPQFLKDLAPYLPTYHYGQLVWNTVGSPQATKAFTGIAAQGGWEHGLWLLGTFLVFGLLAIVGYQRDRGDARR